MKKMLLPLAVLAFVATSCDTTSKDSTMTANFYEYNLITDRSDPSAPAQVSSAVYNVLLNWTQTTAEVGSSDLTISNQKYSFETQPMPLSMGYLVQEGTSNYVDYCQFKDSSSVGTGAKVSNVDASFGYVSYIYNGVYINGIETVTSSKMRLMMGYDFNDRYHVQTFWPECFYAGTTSALKDGTTNTSVNTIYRVQLDFEKKEAKCIIYNPVLADENTKLPKAIVLEGIAICLTNTDYYLTASNPTVKVLDDKNMLIPNNEYGDKTGQLIWGGDFNFYITSTDLTRASINYELCGNKINFSGASTIQVASSVQ